MQFEKVDTNIIPRQTVLILLTANTHLRFLWEAVDLNTKPCQNLNEGNLTLRLLTWYHYNLTLNERKH